MNKRIAKHIKASQHVKVYLTGADDIDLGSFEGIILEQTDKFILMNDLMDFNYDGLAVIRKRDINEIKRTTNEVFFDAILKKEGIKKAILKRYKKLDFHLSSFTEMFTSLQDAGTPVIIERKYGSEDVFQIGPIEKAKQKRVHIKYFNAEGEYDAKPVVSKFKDITFFRIDSPYANTMSKYLKE